MIHTACAWCGAYHYYRGPAPCILRTGIAAGRAGLPWEPGGKRGRRAKPASPANGANPVGNDLPPLS